MNRRSQIIAAAIEIADADGLDRLSMRRLAEKIGIKAMSLYNHIASKDELFSLITDASLGESYCPSPQGNWRSEMRKRASSLREVLLRHRWLAFLLVSRLNTGTELIRRLDASLGCLHGAGMSLIDADLALNAIDSLIYGFTLQELHFPIEFDDYSKTAEEYTHLLPRDRYPHFRQLTDAVTSGSYNGKPEFERGLECVLDGIEGVLLSARTE